MTQISKRILWPEVEKKIHNVFIECIVRCRDQRAAANFVEVLLTDTEKLMISKRVSIALMLVKGYSAPQIDEKLKVSLGTIYTVKAWLDSKGLAYKGLLLELAREDRRQEKDHKRFLDEARNDTPRWGTNWKEAKKQQWKHPRENKTPF